MSFVVAVCLLFCAPTRAAEPDPFEGVAESTAATARAAGMFGENFGFRREVLAQGAATPRERAASRVSAGFEVLKKLSTETKTVAAFDFQGRLVRRDRFIAAPNDMEGMHRAGWTTEYHNAYADVYDIGGVGRLNARLGRFYVPFGLNLRTDTHGTLLQLSNERQFGFERDWYAGLWGGLNDWLDYDAHYLAGSGYDLKFRGQGGLGALRLSLANRALSEHGLEGGASYLGGRRLQEGAIVDTQRAGADARWRRAVPGGLGVVTTELSGGRDDRDAVVMQLHQLEFLRASRRWGLAAQYRRHWRRGAGADESAIGEATWYFRNDPASSSLHWLKLAVESREGGPAGIVQYYRYW